MTEQTFLDMKKVDQDKLAMTHVKRLCKKKDPLLKELYSPTTDLVCAFRMLALTPDFNITRSDAADNWHVVIFHGNNFDLFFATHRKFTMTASLAFLRFCGVLENEKIALEEDRNSCVRKCVCQKLSL